MSSAPFSTSQMGRSRRQVFLFGLPPDPRSARYERGRTGWQQVSGAQRSVEGAARDWMGGLAGRSRAARRSRNGQSYVGRGEAPATAKVRLVLAQRPKPTIDSPQAILDTIVQTAKQQCQKITSSRLVRAPEN